MLKHLITFGAGVYVGIYLDQNRQIHPVPSPKQLLNYAVEQLDKFLTGVRSDDPPRSVIKQIEDDFFKDVDDWFKPSKRFP